MFLEPALRAPVAISLGAIAGALSRYYITQWLNQELGNGFPYGTFLINLTGCLGMGFFVTWAIEKSLAPDLRLLIATGFLGAYTTFSTYGLDTMTLFNSGRGNLAGLYWGGSAVLGVLCVQLGVVLANLGK
ncbi:MAG: fluoride efflux transporter CrcB [Synechococcales cyanobacterium RU_4_20]|nr:fluoride efflux transporter CrcB [Synechococcales cyanobacterium RU_4_20]NJR67851.1 fluoride efflux transporter CrcB [Synechococcales cyanobacterium CRU_2_2]